MKTEKPKGGAILTLTVAQNDAKLISDWVAEHLERTVVALSSGLETTLEIYFETDVEAELASLALEGFPIIGKSIHEYVVKDWAESWRNHFVPMDIGERLHVRPTSLPGEDVRRTDRLEIVLNPGLSFGTGNHFTTHFCLEQLDRLIPDIGARTVFDVGTGTGVLAIASIKLGAEKAFGLDFDELCLEQAASNAETNGVAKQIEFIHHDITDGWFDAVYDIVCANVYASILSDTASHLLGAARSYLVVSGIREEEIDKVAYAFVRVGGREILRDSDGEWGGLVIGAESSDLLARRTRPLEVR